MNKYVVTVALLFCSNLIGQVKQPVVVSGDEVERQWREQQELGDLYKRAAASRFVVVGTVMKDIAIAERGAQPSMDSNVGGILHSVRVEEVLCQQKDFTGTISPRILPKGPRYSSHLCPLETAG